MACVIPFLTACGSIVHAPPSPPSAALPVMPDLPASPPAAGSGRVIVDTPGEAATVARVVERYPYSYPVLRLHRGRVPVASATAIHEKTESLCTTPCVVDLPNGTQTLRFKSTADPYRTSLARVDVSSTTSVVRHAIGYDNGPPRPYYAGILTTVIGGVVLTAGAALTVASVVAKPTTNLDGATHDPGAGVLPLALGLDLAGLALATYGIVLMYVHRPERQSGATTQFVLP